MTCHFLTSSSILPLSPAAIFPYLCAFYNDAWASCVPHLAVDIYCVQFPSHFLDIVRTSDTLKFSQLRSSLPIEHVQNDQWYRIVTQVILFLRRFFFHRVYMHDLVNVSSRFASFLPLISSAFSFVLCPLISDDSATDDSAPRGTLLAVGNHFPCFLLCVMRMQVLLQKASRGTTHVLD